MARVEPNPSSAQKTLREIAGLIDGEIVGNGDVLIKGACGIKEAVDGDITFLAHSKYLPQLKESRASAVIVSRDVEFREKPVIRTPNPALAFLKVMDIWRPRLRHEPGVHPKAVVSPSARVAATASIGPGAVVEDGCEIGEGAVIQANVFVGRNTRIGRDALVYPNVVIREASRIDDRVILHCGAVIGSDGYGYETLEGRHVKIPQIGNVWIQEDVEIGANSCVDRGRFGSTVVKKGTKVDNLVQIAHNVVIGENCLIVSQVGIAGSVEIGDGVTLAGQVGIAGHLKVGPHSVIGAQSGVFTSVPDHSVLLGSPPLPIRQQMEMIVMMQRLPELFRDLKELKKKFEERQSGA